MGGSFYLVLTVGLVVKGGGGQLAPIAIGLILAIQVYNYASVSGACLNPAVTLAVVISGRNKISPAKLAAYTGCQLLGAMVGALIAVAITGRTFSFDIDE